MIGSKLKTARAALNLTQEEVAEKIQISRQTLSNWENEKTYPDITSIVKLSELYGVSLDFLLKDDEKILKHMEESSDMVKSNRLLILIWTICPLIFLLANLLTGGIVVGDRHFAIHGPAFFYTLLLTIALSLVSFAIIIVNLLKRKSAAKNARLKDIIEKSDVLRLAMAAFFLLIPIFALCFFL